MSDDKPKYAPQLKMVGEDPEPDGTVTPLTAPDETHTPLTPPALTWTYLKTVKQLADKAELALQGRRMRISEMWEEIVQPSIICSVSSRSLTRGKACWPCPHLNACDEHGYERTTQVFEDLEGRGYCTEGKRDIHSRIYKPTP